MYGGELDFGWMEYCFHNPDVTDNHRWNYLRHKLLDIDIFLYEEDEDDD